MMNMSLTSCNRKNNSIIITGYTGSATEVVIPNAINGKTVTGIGDYAFRGCSSLTSVSIPEGVTSIGYQAFNGCSSLTSVSIPEGVTSIGDYVFYNCSSLTSASIPKGMTNIGDYAFAWCSDLMSMSIPEGVTNIRDHAFAWCHNLASVSIPKSMAIIGYYAFSECGGLKDVHYAGSQEQWKKIEIGKANESLLAAIRYGSSDSENTDKETSPKTAQSVTASDLAKTYGAKPFSLGAKSSGNGKLSYAVSDTKVATVDASGKVTVKGCGITNITITAAETDTYSKAQKTITLTVKPKKMTLSSVKSKKTKTAIVKWKKDKTASGYIIECAADSKFKKNNVKTEIKKNKTTNATVKKLKGGKKYYVRICAYAKSGKVKVQGDRSKAKTVKVKKKHKQVIWQRDGRFWNMRKVSV